jgi:hypothetical protein
MSGETKRVARDAAHDLEALDHSGFLRRFPDNRTSFTKTPEKSGSVYEIGVELAESADGSISVVVTAEDVTQPHPAVESESFVLTAPS